MSKTIRVVRIMEYVGERNKVKLQLGYSDVPLHGQIDFGNGVLIKSTVANGLLEDEVCEELDGWHYLEDFKDVPESRGNKLRGLPKDGTIVWAYDDHYQVCFTALWSDKLGWSRVESDNDDFHIVAWHSLPAHPRRFLPS